MEARFRAGCGGLSCTICCCLALALTLRGTDTIRGLIGWWVTVRMVGCARAFATVLVIRAAALADSFFSPPPDGFDAFLVVAGFVPPVALETVVEVPVPRVVVVGGRERTAAADLGALGLGM